MPEYEPRGCPRGASFSWYTYSPLRLRYPNVRGSLLEAPERIVAALACTCGTVEAVEITPTTEGGAAQVT